MRILRTLFSVLVLALSTAPAFAVDYTVLDGLKTQMDYDNQRQVVLSKNIANADTPGYKAMDLKPLNFKKLDNAHHLQMKVTSPMHLAGTHAPGRFNTNKDKHTFETSPTGNNIVLEDEILKAEQNNLEYQTATTLFKQLGSMQTTAISSK